MNLKGFFFTGSDALFTINMHHGGVFHSGMYVGGILNYIDKCDTAVQPF